MSLKKSADFPHFMTIAKLTFVFAGLLVIFGIILATNLGLGELKFAGAAECSDIYSPVCGTDGITYINGCNANISNVEIECNGKCPCGDGDLYEKAPPVVY